MKNKKAKRTIMVLASVEEYKAISGAAAAARMSRSSWLRAAAEEKLKRARKDACDGEAA